MNEIAEYIQNTIGENFHLVETNEKEGRNIPLFISNNFNIGKGKIFEMDVFLCDKLNDEHLTPLQYKKQQVLLEEKLKAPVIFVIPEIQSYNRKRLIEKKVNFIIQDKQMFIPQLLIDLKEHHVKTDKGKYLQPVAQLIVLHQILRGNLNDLTYKEIEALLGYPYLSISRAIENLTDYNLCKTEGKKEKIIHFHLDKKEFWNKALPLLRTPVLKQVYINNPLPENLIYKTNMNALSHYTDMNDDGLRHCAIEKKRFNELKKKGIITNTSDYDGDFIVETWRYDPGILTENEYVDPLSLYLLFKDTRDERTEEALDQLVKKYVW